MISFADETMTVSFDRFDLETYGLFLRTKRIPEAIIEFNPQSETYLVKAPARFAALLGVETPTPVKPWLPFPAWLFDYQAWIVKLALDAKRFAIWADCGLGKTVMFTEFSRQVIHRTDGRVLILSPLNIIEQTMEQIESFYGMPVVKLESREYLMRWCKGEIPDAPKLAISNYEKFIDGPMDELRYLAGLVLDESAILKSGGGVIKWNLIKSARGIEYKLSCTATPAPNDTMEYASQAAFLEKLRTEGEILWTFFQRNKEGVWQVKPHAREAFYEFMSTWSIYLRKPGRYGFRDNFADIPEPKVLTYEITATPEQLEAARQFVHADKGLLVSTGEKMGVTERGKLNQIAKGFIYLVEQPEDDPFSRPKKLAKRIESLKPDFVAKLIDGDARDGRNPLVWTIFDEESVILFDLLQKMQPTYKVAILHGKLKPAERKRIIEDYRHGRIEVLISKASLLGYGMNFQHCASMIFSGWNDSYEQWYQAIRRAYRYGQTRQLNVHVPFIPELEGHILDNVLRKQTQFERDTDQQEQLYIKAFKTISNLQN